MTVDKQASLTDPHAHSMMSDGKGIVGYNVQTAVDTKHHLIVAHELTNEGHDRYPLSSMAEQALEAMKLESISLSEEKGIAVMCTPTRGCMTQRPLPWGCLGDNGGVEYKMHDWTPLNLAIRITFISIDFALRGSSGVLGQKSKKKPKTVKLGNPLIYGR